MTVADPSEGLDCDAAFRPFIHASSMATRIMLPNSDITSWIQGTAKVVL